MASRIRPKNNIFGIGFDGMSFGDLGRDTAGDFVPSPDIDLATIAATLAAGPGPEYSYTSAASLALNHKRSPRLRKMRPHREEHVKRLRISHDPFGNQGHKIPPYAITLPTQQQPLATGSVATKARDGQTVTPGNGVFSRLCRFMGKVMGGMLFGNESHA